MRTTISHTITFGRGGNATEFLGAGWSAGEDGFTWAIDTESELFLPAINAPVGMYVEIACGAWRPQRLKVLLNDATIGACRIAHEGIYGWAARAYSGPTRLRLAHPDAVRPSDVHGSGDTRALALSVRKIRLFVILDPDGVATVGDQDLPLSFESLGDNCDLGLVQRSLGAEPLGLLRFSAAPIRPMVHALDGGFSGITDDLAIAVSPDGTEWSVSAPRYEMSWHTFTSPQDMTADAMRDRERKRLPFLVRKFMEDATEGRKVFVVKRDRAIPDHEILPLFLALRRIGPAPMLVLEKNPARAGEVSQVMRGLARGYISQFGETLATDNAAQMAEWTEVLNSALWTLQHHVPESSA